MAEHSIDVHALRRAPAPRVSAEGAALVAEGLSLYYEAVLRRRLTGSTSPFHGSG